MTEHDPAAVEAVAQRVRLPLGWSVRRGNTKGAVSDVLTAYHEHLAAEGKVLIHHDTAQIAATLVDRAKDDLPPHITFGEHELAYIDLCAALETQAGDRG